VSQGKNLSDRIRKSCVVALLLGAVSAWSQETPKTAPPSATQADSMTAAIEQLQEQVKELRDAVVEVRSEAAQYRAETADLRRELQATRSQLAAATPAPSATATPVVDGAAPGSEAPPLEDRVAALEESSQLVSGKVDDQYQTKVESASKYHVRFSGILLLNLFSNRGSTDTQDFPSYVNSPNGYSSDGSFGATLRQSELGFEVFGPTVAGAKTSGEIQFDFSGGFPTLDNGVTFGLVRLRTASMRLDWEHTSVVAGQDNFFLSPLSPTSFATLAVPAFSYAGNLWGWIPQVRVEHRFDLSDKQSITLQGGILDGLTGEPPYVQDKNIPQAGERPGQPGYGTRVMWTRNMFGQTLHVAAAGYYNRQDWGFDRNVDGWAGMADWDIPLASRMSLSGEFYRGRGVGGLGGGIGRSVLFSGNPLDPTTSVQALNSIGGWSQLKFRATPKLEFNAAFGLDNPLAQDVRDYSNGQGYLSTLVQNRSALVNFIYRPRSNLLFSAEYRHLRTSVIDSNSYNADQVNLMMGILF
jgi:hypothetical protein